MVLLFHSQNPELINRFYADIVSSSIFSQPVSFLTLFQHQLSNYSIILHLQSFTRNIVSLIIKSNTEKLQQIKLIIQNQISSSHHLKNDVQTLTQQKIIDIINALSSSIYNRLQEIKLVYLMQTISLGSLYLKDVNWKITKTISSNSRSFEGQKNQYLFCLSLMLCEGGKTSEQKERKISLEMNKVQLKQLLGKLKGVKSDIN